MNKDNYEDIINLPHYVSERHPQMSIEARAAQFAPFAALTGYQDAVKETVRLTEKRIELDEEVKLQLNNKLKKIIENINANPKITITYFIHDNKKDGGKYVNKTGYIKKIDNVNEYIILADKTKIPINEIINIIDEI